MNFKLLALLTLSINVFAFDIYPQVSGQVVYIANTGDEFSKGDELVRIDNSDAQLELKYNQELLKNYEQNFADKKLILEQQQELFDRLAGSQRDLTNATLEFNAAKRELDAFSIKLKILNNQLKKYSILAPFDGKVETVVHPRNVTNINNPQSLLKITQQ